MKRRLFWKRLCALLLSAALLAGDASAVSASVLQEAPEAEWEIEDAAPESERRNEEQQDVSGQTPGEGSEQESEKGSGVTEQEPAGPSEEPGKSGAGASETPEQNAAESSETPAPEVSETPEQTDGNPQETLEQIEEDPQETPVPEAETAPEISESAAGETSGTAGQDPAETPGAIGTDTEMPSESTEQIPGASEETAEELPPEEDQGFQVLDQDGNPLSVNLEEVDDPEALEAQVDFSRVSGELVWLQDIHVETEGTVNVRIRLENLDGKVVTVVHFPDTGEVEYPEAEILDGEVLSFGLDSFSPVAVYAAEDLYHYSREDMATILTWKEKYIPNGFEDLLGYSDSWWDSLYDYERSLAEFMEGLIENLSDTVYDGQDLFSCIRILEGGVPAEAFFDGTVYQGLTVEDLYTLSEYGYDLEDVYAFLAGACGWEDTELFREYLQSLESEAGPDAGPEALAGMAERIMPANPMLYALSDGDLVASMSVSSTGFSGTGHGTIWKLSIGGADAICATRGRSARNGFLYNANPGTYEVRTGGEGYLATVAAFSGDYYACGQIALWLFLESESYTRTEVEERAYALLDESDTTIESMLVRIWNYYRRAAQNPETYYVFHSDNANAQTIFTSDFPDTYPYEGGGGEEPGPGGDEEYETASVSASAEDSIEVEARVTVTKHDSITDEVLEGTSIKINGKTYTSDESGEVTHREEDSHTASASGPSYTYVTDWGSLTPEQQADADGHGYYHSYDEAYDASWGEANQQVQDELDDWADSWSADFYAEETAPPYGYCDNEENTYDTSAGDGAHKYHDFYNKPWEAWIKVTKHDSVTGQTDFSLADAEFCVYEYNKDTGEYELYRYSDRQKMLDQGDGTYQVGPLYYNPRNQGKFMILETRSPYGYTIDRETNRFYFEITGEKQITYTQGNQYNQTGTFSAAPDNMHDFQAYNEPWKIRVQAMKIDENTGNLLSGVRFDILRFNRDSNDYEVKTSYAPVEIKVSEQADQTYLSDWIYWNYQNQGKLYLVESEARKGYFGDWKDRLAELITGHPAGWHDDGAHGKNAYYFEITGSRTEEGVVEGYNNQTTQTASANNQGTIANERTKGRVRVVKYDTESESQIIQGDTTLEGAVYELRAAEDIIHADGHTGVIYRAGDLVMTGTVGKTPVVDAAGYMLNTEGQRYISYGGEIRYRDTPGEFSFYNIELGKYVLKEVKASEGYMLDETAYELTFTYDDETQRVILRDETSGEDKNTLTADDQDDGNETIYTGDHVQKKAFSIVKTSDNQFQTELEPAAGAGFTVYLVSELQGVKDKTLVPANGENWSGLDIQQFYDYDFTQDRPATVYKRALETWTEGDHRWLEPVPGGKLNEYRVGEMFTDEQGALTSPELPYGTYVVVETTTPEKHVMARPFFVFITDDGGVVYTDESRQEVKETFSEQKDIRFGDHANSRVYKDENVYEENAVEGRLPQDTRYISDNQTESWLRLIKADTAFLPPDGTVLKPEEMAEGTVLKEGSQYRIRIVSMTDRELETFTKTGWKQDGDGYIWYYEPTSRITYGTEESPFAPTFLRDGSGKITDCYLTLPAKLPTGVFEVTELQAPEGYVLNGYETTLTDTSTEDLNIYEVSDTPAEPIRFILDNNSVYPDGQMGEHKYTLADSYGNITCTVFQDNQEQKGVLELIKYGEQLYDAKDSGTSLKEKLDDSYFRRIWREDPYNAKDYIFEYQDAPVAGAVFEVYAAEDIYTQELDKELLEEYGVDISDYLVWGKDRKVAEITTDSTGYAYLADLYIGRYYIKETAAGEGFVRNPEIQEFEITPQDQKVSLTWVASIWENERQKIALETVKQDVESGEPLEGAVYGLYNAEDIFSQVVKNPDPSAPDYRHIDLTFEYIPDEEGRLLIPADTLIATAVTDQDGAAVFDEDLPLGQYYVKELEAPLGYTSTDQTESVDGSYQGQETEIQDHTDLIYQNQKTKRVITKSDIVSGVHIAGAYLEVWEILQDDQGNARRNEDGSYVLADRPADSWVSAAEGEELHYFYEADGFYMEIPSPEELPEGKDLIVKEGHLIEGLTAGRQYILRETLAPENYVGWKASSDDTKEQNQIDNQITEEVMFTVEDSNIVAEHDLKDQRTVGAFSVTKEGEFFVGTEEQVSFTDRVKNLFLTVFRYLTGRVEQAEFEVYVKEDIFTPDGTGEYASWVNAAGETMILKAGTRIETLITDRQGLASIENLPLGTYYLRETKAGDGNFLLNREEKEIVLSYAGQDIPVVYPDSVQYVNARQKIRIQIHKMEEDTDLPLQGAVFGLYAAEDLPGYAVTEEKAVSRYPDALVEKDSLIETVETDASGMAVFQADVPNGRYYVRELQAPDGYLKTDEVWYFDASYRGADSEETLNFEQDIYNEISDVTVSKQDLTNGEEIEGAHLEIVEESTGTAVDRWISEKTPHRIGGIRVSEGEEHVYVLRETLPADGYVTAEEIRFLVRETDGLREVWIDQDGWKPQDDRCIVMKDDVTKVEIRKTKADGVSMLAGADLQLLDAEGNAVAAWTSTEEAYTIERLPIGTYTLRETKAPSGYRKAEDMTVEVLDTPEVQSFVLMNQRKPGSSGGGSGEDTSSAPQPSAPGPVSPVLTGDQAMAAVWIGAAGASVAGILYLIHKKRRS